MGLCALAGPRAGVPRRALRDRPARGGGADRDDSRWRPALGPTDEAPLGSRAYPRSPADRVGAMSEERATEQRSPASTAAIERRAVPRDYVPRMRFTRRQLIASALFVLLSVAILYFVLPKLLGLKETWNRIQQGNVWWFGLAAALEACSFLSYVALFRAVFARGRTRIEWRESYQITMAGLAATRVFASAGAGGIVLTAWALRRSGKSRRLVARRMLVFLSLLYFVYMATLVVDGLGLRLAVFEAA